MGNLCSTSSDKPKKDNFASPGRVLGSAPARSENATASVPHAASSGGGQTLGGRDTNDPRTAAAKAAEDRLGKPRSSSTAAGGKLQAQLDAQKKQTMNATLQQSAVDNTAARDADASAAARQWN